MLVLISFFANKNLGECASIAGMVTAQYLTIAKKSFAMDFMDIITNIPIFTDFSRVLSGLRKVLTETLIKSEFRNGKKTTLFRFSESN